MINSRDNTLESYRTKTMQFNHTAKIILPELKVKTSPSGERFYRTPEGNWYPSITTILSAEEKPWLIDWRNSLGDKRADKEQKRCAERGEAVHLMCERYLNNELDVDNIRKDFKQEHIVGFNQMKLLLNKVDNIKAQEVALYSDRLRVAGRTDCIGEYNGTLSVIDFKTSNQNKSREMIEDYFLQSTAYALMWHERTGEPIETIVILMSVEKGIMPLKFVEKIDKYIKPLLKRINTYHKERE